MKNAIQCITFAATLLAGTLDANAQQNRQRQGWRDGPPQWQNQQVCPACGRPTRQNTRQSIPRYGQQGQRFGQQQGPRYRQQAPTLPPRFQGGVGSQTQGPALQWQQNRQFHRQRGYAQQQGPRGQYQSRGKQGTRELAPQQRGKNQQRREQAMKRFDHDGDGQLSPEERKALKEAMQKRLRKERRERPDRPAPETEEQ